MGRWGCRERIAFVVASLIAMVGIIAVLGQLIAAIGETTFGMAANETWLYVFLVAFVGGISTGYAVALITSRLGRRS
jgi:hypothetical protein